MWLVVGFAYPTITIANGSATWCMRLVSIELRNSTGARLDLTEAALHTLGYTISINIFFAAACLYCIDVRQYAWSKFNRPFLRNGHVKQTSTPVIAHNSNIYTQWQCAKVESKFKELNAPHTPHSAPVLCDGTTTLPVP